MHFLVMVFEFLTAVRNDVTRDSPIRELNYNMTKEGISDCTCNKDLAKNLNNT